MLSALSKVQLTVWRDHLVGDRFVAIVATDWQLVLLAPVSPLLVYVHDWISVQVQPSAVVVTIGLYL